MDVIRYSGVTALLSSLMMFGNQPSSAEENCSLQRLVPSNIESHFLAVYLYFQQAYRAKTTRNGRMFSRFGEGFNYCRLPPNRKNVEPQKTVVQLQKVCKPFSGQFLHKDCLDAVGSGRLFPFRGHETNF